MAAAKETLNTWKEKLNSFLHQKNYATDLLAKVEEKAKVDRLYIFLGNLSWACVGKLQSIFSSRPKKSLVCIFVTFFFYFRPCSSVCFVAGLWIWSLPNCYMFGICLSCLCLVSCGPHFRAIASLSRYKFIMQVP